MAVLDLIIDPSGAEEGARRASAAADGYARGAAARASQATGALEGALISVGRQASGFGTALEGVGRRLIGFRDSIVSIQGALAALGIGVAVRGFVDLADRATQVENRLRLVTGSAQELAAVQAQLFEAAQSTRSSFEGLAELYSRVSLASQELGVSQQQVIQFSTGIGQALAITGTSAQQAAGSLLQLGQAIGGGVVRAEEFNSILEGTPRIAQAVADGLAEAGGSVARLRSLVIEGEVSSRAFFEAFTSQLPVLQQEFETTEATVGQALTQLQNALLQSVGAADDASGATRDLVASIQSLASAVQSAAFQQGLATIASGLALVARNLDLVGIAAAAFIGLNVGAAFGPIGAAVGLLAGALGGAVVAFGDFSDAADDAARTSRARVTDVKTLQVAYGDLAGAVAGSTEALRINARAIETGDRVRRALNQAAEDSINLSREQARLATLNTRLVEADARQARSIRAQIKETTVAADALRISYDANIDAAKRFEEQQEDLLGAVVRVAEGARDAANATTEVDEATKKATISTREQRDAADALNLTYRDTSTFFGGAEEALERYGIATGEIGDKQRGLNDAVRDFDADPMVDAVEDLGSAITSTFESGLNTALGSLLGFENEFTRIISRLVARLAEQQFEINIGGTVNGNGVVQGGSGNDILGQLQDLPVSDLLGSIFGGAASGVGSFAGFSTAAAANSFGSIGNFAIPTGSLVSSAPVAGSLPGSFLSGAGGLLSAGAGIAGSFIGSKIFDQRNPLLGSIGSGVGAIGGGLAGGAIAGAAAGSIVPGIGTAIGALIGAILGSAAGLIGGPPSGEQQAALFSGTSGEFQSFSGRTGKNFSQENQDAASSIGEAASALLVALNQITGTTSAFRDVEGDVSNRDGALLRLSGNDAGLQTAAQIVEEDDIAATVVQAFLEATQDLKPEYEAIFRDLLEPSDDLLRTVEGADLRDVAGNIDVEKLQRALDLIAAIDSATRALEDLGPVEFIGPVEQFYRSVKDEIARVRSLNEEFGADISAVEELGERLIADFNAGFIQGLEDEIRVLEGRPYLPAARTIIENTQNAINDAAQEGLGEAVPLLTERFSLQFGAAIEDIDLTGLVEIRDYILGLEDPSDTSAQALDILDAAIWSLSDTAEEVAGELNRALLPALFGVTAGLEFVDGAWRQVQQATDLRGDIAAGLAGNVVPIPVPITRDLTDISDGLTPRVRPANANAAPDPLADEIRRLESGFASIILSIEASALSAAESISAGFDRYIANIERGLSDALSALAQQRDAFAGAAGTAGSLIADLTLRNTSAQQGFEQLLASISPLLSGAATGSPGAISSLSGALPGFLGALDQFSSPGTPLNVEQTQSVLEALNSGQAAASEKAREAEAEMRALQEEANAAIQRAEAQRDRMVQQAEEALANQIAQFEALRAEMRELIIATSLGDGSIVQQFEALISSNQSNGGDIRRLELRIADLAASIRITQRKAS